MKYLRGLRRFIPFINYRSSGLRYNYSAKSKEMEDKLDEKFEEAKTVQALTTKVSSTSNSGTEEVDQARVRGKPG
jgi:hypothetical protein